MSGYIRQSAGVILDDLPIDAQPLNNEFNALRDAFDNTTGHKHDGTVGEGPQLSLTNSVLGQLPVINGGTGANSAANARTNLGLAVGTNVQAYDAGLQSISALATLADRMIYTTALDVYAVTALTPFARSVLDDTDASTVLSTLGVSAFIKTLLDDVDATAARTTLDVPSNANLTTTNTNLSTHTSRTDNPHSVTKAQVGLGNVDNTSDVNKPVSTAQASADAAVASNAASNLAAHTGNTSNPHNTTKAQVGLANVDNTSDANKPVSTATQTALNGKVNTTDLVWRKVAEVDFTSTPVASLDYTLLSSENRFRLRLDNVGPASGDQNILLYCADSGQPAEQSAGAYYDHYIISDVAGTVTSGVVTTTNTIVLNANAANSNIAEVVGTIGSATSNWHALSNSRGNQTGGSLLVFRAANRVVLGRKPRLFIVSSTGTNMTKGRMLLEAC